MSLETYLRAAPKAELHLHLEGAIRPTTALTLAERNGVALPYATLEELRDWFRFRDFAHFIEVYAVASVAPAAGQRGQPLVLSWPLAEREGAVTLSARSKRGAPR